MALSDNEKRKTQTSTANRSIYNGDNKWWSDRQKLEAVQTFMMLGNVAMTARVLKIPDDTMRRWRKTEWWREIEGELKVQDDLMLSARMKKIMEKTFDAVEDRLENGDWVYDQKTGQLRRKHINARDAHKIGMDLIDKRNFILGKQQPTVSEGQVQDKLESLATKFAEMVNKKITPPSEVVDVQSREVAQGEQESFQDSESEFDSPTPLQENGAA